MFLKKRKKKFNFIYANVPGGTRCRSIAHIDEGILAYPVLMHQKAEQKQVAGLMLVNVARTPLPHLS